MMKKRILEYINLISYILSIPLVFVIIFIYLFDLCFCVAKTMIILLICIIFIQIFHYKKTKILNIGLRLLITVVILFIGIFAIKEYYYIVKNKYSTKLINSIEKIEMHYPKIGTSDIPTLNEEDLQSKRLEFIKDVGLVKSTYKLTIYYKNGKIEESKILDTTGNSVYVIQGDWYYLKERDIK